MSVMEVTVRLWKLSVSVSVDRMMPEKEQREKRLVECVDPNLVHQYPAVAWETKNWMAMRK